MKSLQILLTVWFTGHFENAVSINRDPMSFAEQTKHPDFVDKTMLLKVIFRNLNGTYHLITYPSKFGKTSNLKMIQSFVELEADKFGQVKKKWDTNSYKLFTNKSLALKITQYHNLIRKHLAEYPVIYISFRDITRPTFDQTVRRLNYRIRACYEKYHWLYEILKNDSLQEKSDEWGYLLRGQIEFWDRNYAYKCGAIDLQNSLFALSKILCYYLDKKVFVLIDDYDAPLIEAQSLGGNITYDAFHIQCYVNGMIQKLFKPTCVDQYVEYGFITGTTSYFVSSHFAKIDDIHYHRFLDNHVLAPFFGFDLREIRELLDRHRHLHLQVNGTDVLHIYSGYQIANTSTRVYNPCFYKKYLNESNRNQKSLNVIEKDFLTSISRNPAIRECLVDLLNSRLIRFKLLTHVNVGDLRKFFRVVNGTGIGGDYDVDYDVFYTLLFEMGYLSYTNLEQVFVMPKEISNIFTNSSNK